MARTYTDTWSTSVTKTTSPYYIVAGKPTTATVSSGMLQMPPNTSDYTNWEMSITRGTVGSTSASDTLAPQGNFAMQFTINTASIAQYQGFSSHAKAAAVTGATNKNFPLIYKTSATTHRLMWTTPGFWNEHYGSSSYQGDFNGKDVDEAGVWKVVVIRKDFNTTTGISSQMMIVVLPSGTVYKTGWYAQNDDGHQVIALTNSYWAGSNTLYNLPVSSISYVDQLTQAQVDQIVTNAEIDLSPIPMADNGTGDYGDVPTVTLSAPTELDASYTEIRYTLDGTEPTTSSTLYTSPITVGSPFTPGTTKQLKCAYFSSTLGKAQTKTYKYTFKVLEPIPSMVISGRTYGYFTKDITLTWTKAPPTNTEYWYTMDGTDPQTSGTAIKWVNGAVYPFNSHPDATIVAYGTQGSLPNYLKVRAKYTTTNSWSAMSTTWTLYCQLTVSGYAQVSTVGGYNTDAVLSWGTYDETGAVSAVPVTTEVTINGTKTVYDANEGSLNIAFGDVTSYRIVAKSKDGLLATYSKSGGITFGQAPLLVDKSSVISSDETVSVVLTNPNPNSTIYYTVDGTAPTESSPSSTASSIAVSIPNGSMLRAYAKRRYLTSTLVTSEVFSEFEVGSAVTATRDGTGFHYYSATQRVELNSPLGETVTSVTVGSNVSSTSVSCTVDGTASSMYLWDVADQKGAVNAPLTSIKVSDFKSKFWSRLAYTGVTAALSFKFNKTDWMTPGRGLNMTGEMTLFKIIATSKLSAVVFEYVVDCALYTTKIKRYRVSHGGTAETIVTTNAGTLVSGSSINNTITLAANSTYVSLSDGTGSSVENLTGDEVGTTWVIDGVFNPYNVDIPAIATSGLEDTSVSMPISITTTAISGLLRRAPATVFIEASAAFTSKSSSLSFLDKEAVASQDIYVPCGPLKAHASVGFDPKSSAATVDGPFEWKLPYVFDSSAAFDVSVDFNARFERNPGQDITLYANQENYSGSATGIDVGTAFATLRCVTDVDANGVEIAGSSALELYAGSTATRIVAPSAQSRFKLRLVKTAGSATATAYGNVGETEVVLGTVDVPAGAIEFKFVRKGKATRPAPMHTIIFGSSVSGAIRSKAITSANLSGAWIMRKGSAVSIPATTIPVPNNGIKALFFNTATGLVTSEDLAYEPSDGRILLGVLDTRGDTASWSSLLFSKTVRIRSDVLGTLGAGSIIGAGDSISTKDGRVLWLSSGYTQSLPIGTTDWVRPNVYVDLFRKKQVIRTFERQPIKLSLSVGQLLA